MLKKYFENWRSRAVAAWAGLTPEFCPAPATAALVVALTDGLEGDIWTAFAGMIGLLERVGELEDAEVLFITADYLNADG